MFEFKMLFTLNCKSNLILFIVVIVLCCGNCSHVKGVWNTKDFFKFLLKFGVQKTDVHYEKDTKGYVFGNITARTNFSFSHLVTFSVLDRRYFLEYYGNRSVDDKERACQNMFRKISTIAFDVPCFENKPSEDFIRKVPCNKNEVCKEDKLGSVVNGYQLTFEVTDVKEPRFWYLSLVACYRNETTCEWHHFKEEAELEYDIWFVNGNPNISSFNPLIYQFSFDRQNTILLYLVFFLCYMVLVPLQMYAVTRQHHPVTKLFTVSLLLEFVGLLFNLLDVTKFSIDGVGYHRIAIAGDILDILSRTTFMLLLLLLAKGWAVTRMELTWKPLVFTIWFVYGVVHILLYVWNLTEVDIIEDIDEYQTWPGWLILVLRCQIIVWFLFELRTTMLYEHNSKKLNFFLHFGASALVWFIYLPILALIAMQIPAFWRFKLLLGITYSADCLAYCVMAHLLWPTRSEQYFLLAYQHDAREELDEFNEAPHVINSVGYAELRQASSCDSITQEITKVIT